jgi:uncharacterized membrane protein
MKSGFLKYFLRGIPVFILLILVVALIGIAHDVLGGFVAKLPVPDWSQSLISVGLSILVILVVGWANPMLKVLSRVTFMRLLGNTKKYPLVLIRVEKNWLFGIMTEHLENQKPNEMFKAFVPNVPIPISGYPVIVPRENIRRLDMTLTDFFHQIATAGLAPLGGEIKLQDGQPPLD